MIDAFPESVEQYVDTHTVVAVDVIRATTTAVTAAAAGRPCYPAGDPAEARKIASSLANPLLAGESHGAPVPGFDLDNSPAALAARLDVERPLVLLTSSGTRLLRVASRANAALVSCLRNISATAAIASQYDRVAVVGAGSRGEFRQEDQLACAWIAERLMAVGFAPEDARTAALVRRWSDKPASIIASGKSADFLRRTGQIADLDFVLDHIDDLPDAHQLIAGRVITLSLVS